MDTRRGREEREVGRSMGAGTTSTNVTHTSGGVITKTASYTMKPYDFTVKGDISSGSITITLPPVVEARGKIYTLWCIDADSNDMTITDYGDATLWTDIVLGDDNDYLVLFSNGERWFELSEQSDNGER